MHKSGKKERKEKKLVLSPFFVFLHVRFPSWELVWALFICKVPFVGIRSPHFACRVGLFLYHSRTGNSLHATVAGARNTAFALEHLLPKMKKTFGGGKTAVFPHTRVRQERKCCAFTCTCTYFVPSLIGQIYYAIGKEKNMTYSESTNVDRSRMCA